MAKVKPVQYGPEGEQVVIGYSFECPGCKSHHWFITNPEYARNQKAPCWQFNGDVNSPTFSPSLLYRGTKYPSGGEWPTDDEEKRVLAGEVLQMIPCVCHSFVRNGQIQFLGDCTHPLAGQTVELPDI